MEWRVVPTPDQMLAWVDRLIALRHRQRAELLKLRRLILRQIYLFDAIRHRESDPPPFGDRRDRLRRRTTARRYRQG